VVDVGGSNIKAMLLDASGRPTTERLKHPTARPATPRAVTAEIVAMAQEIGASTASPRLPGVIIDGRVMTAANSDGKWQHFDPRARSRTRQKPVTSPTTPACRLRRDRGKGSSSPSRSAPASALASSSTACSSPT
jgi:hypothetical protein